MGIFGVPSTTTTDIGRRFESVLFTNCVTVLGTKRVRTMASYPQANDLVERFYRQPKATLTANGDPTKWTEALHLVLVAIRTAVKLGLQCSAAEMVLGTPPRHPPNGLTPDHKHSAFPLT